MPRIAKTERNTKETRIAAELRIEGRGRYEISTGIRFFDRLNLAFYIDRQVRLIPLTQLPEALGAGTITTDTLYFDNTIRTKEELESKWPIRLKDSWLGTRYLSGSAPVGATPVK